MDSLPLTAELLPELAEAVDPGTTPLWTALRRVRMPLWCTLEGDLSSPNGTSDLAYVPALPLSELGDPAFRSDHGLDYACVAGAMANGIASVDLVEAMGRAGMVGFFGAAGLDLASVGRAVRELKSRLGERAFGMNLIHSPSEPNLEAAVADLYLREHVT
ncbi:MAG TPA: hypothetical protein PKD86_06240, partial [Gemmatales bacterium]|nr:hypothetical protein [Gemmatales bacterium]